VRMGGIAPWLLGGTDAPSDNRHSAHEPEQIWKKILENHVFLHLVCSVVSMGGASNTNAFFLARMSQNRGREVTGETPQTPPEELNFGAKTK